MQEIGNYQYSGAIFESNLENRLHNFMICG
jgi:hypothetical protein